MMCIHTDTFSIFDIVTNDVASAINLEMFKYYLVNLFLDHIKDLNYNSTLIVFFQHKHISMDYGGLFCKMFEPTWVVDINYLKVPPFFGNKDI